MLIKSVLNGKEINLTGDSTTIKSNNFNVDSQGNMSCNNANITGGKLNISANIEEVVFKVYDGNNYVEIRPSGITMQDSNYNYGQYGVDSFQIQNGEDEIKAYAGQLSIFSGNQSTYIYGSGITTPSITQTSLESKKKNFEKLEDVLNIIKNAEIYKYNLKSEEDTDKKHIGFVIPDAGGNYKTPNEVIAQNGDGIDTYSMTSILWKAIQELTEKVEYLENKLKEEK
jgi:hypothetical protein